MRRIVTLAALHHHCGRGEYGLAHPSRPGVRRREGGARCVPSSNNDRTAPQSLPVLARICTWVVAQAEVRVKRGSTWMILAPLSRAFMGKRKPTGCASAMFEPMMRMQSLYCRSSWKVVAAPRPYVVLKLGTEALCHIRAWFSMEVMPSVLRSFLIR
jgi:hypothetical protein